MGKSINLETYNESSTFVNRNQQEINLVQAYYDDISRYPLLTKEEEKELALKVSKGDKKAKELLINSNLRLVVKVAKKYTFSGLPLLDLIQAGNEGLMKAVEKFEVERGYKFSTYSIHWIRQAVSSYVTVNTFRMIQLPITIVEQINKLTKVQKQFEIEHGKEPTLEELSIAMKLKVPKIKELLSVCYFYYNLFSLDEPILKQGDSNTEDPFLDFIIDEDSMDMTDIVKNRLEINSDGKFISSNEYVFNHENISFTLSSLGLTEKEKLILKLRHGIVDKQSYEWKLQHGYLEEEILTLEQIGQVEGVTRERIRQIESKSLNKIRTKTKSKQRKIELMENKIF